MKKICMITTVSITLKTFVVETAKYLHEKCGYDVTLICNDDPSFFKSLPEYIHYIPVPMSRGISLSGFKAIKVFKKIFKEHKFDMVQYATPNASFYASRAAKSLKVPVRVYCQWGIRYVGFSGIKRMIFKFLEKCVCKKSTHVFAVSPKNMQFAINEGLYKKDKAQVIGNGGTIGVNMREFDIDKKTFWCNEIRKTYGINDKDLVFGFVGRISSDKGVYELLGAFRDVSNENPNAKLMVVGPNDKDLVFGSVGRISSDKGVYELLGALRDVSNENPNAKLMVVGPSDDNDEKLVDLLDWAKSSNKVIFTGGIENSKIKEYYSAMDVLVHPTYREGFGMVIQEAGALAVPVITTKIPGASEVMVDGQSCVLVEPKNTDDLKNAMLSMTKEKADEIGKNAFDRTAKLYERQIMLENQQKAYEKLLGE